MSDSVNTSSNDAGPHAFVDITGVVCPITFVKTKVALEEMEDGQILEIRLNAGEPIQNIPRSLKDEGHRITGVALSKDGTYLLRVMKGGIR
jgi:TusA-related sulfurtransferase